MSDVRFIYQQDARRPFATIATAYTMHGNDRLAFTVIIPMQNAKKQRTFRDEFEAVASELLVRVENAERFRILSIEHSASTGISFRELCIEAERHGFHDWEQP